MKKIWCIAFFIFLLSVSVGCCITSPGNYTNASLLPPQSNTALVSRLQHSSVSLVVKRDNTYKAYCTGVWISAHSMLTAKHCVEIEGLLEGDDVIGMPVKFLIYTNFNTTYPPKESSGIFEANVAALSETSDLAVITTIENVPHSIAPLSRYDILEGTKAHIVGNTAGLPFTYMDGVVSQTRVMHVFGATMKTLHITSSIWFGNSGGPAFDENGNLIGICSFMHAGVPGMSFFMHRDEIKKLLDDNDITYY